MDPPQDTRAPSSSWGPDSRRAAISLTFDNLGEAADLERGLWPADRPLGHHFSVRRVLPRLLDLLDETGLRATFFVEGLNARLYPEALLEISGRGHEVACHGWRHEYWAGLSPAEEARLLERSARELEGLGLRPRGFRPPGGRLNPASLDLLRERGFTYCSPAGSGAGTLEGLAVLPFGWRLIDAYHYLPRFGPLRRSDTGSDNPLPPSRLQEALDRALDETLRRRGYLSLLFHPFLQEPEDRFRALRETLESLRHLAQEGAAWCAPCREIASWLRENPIPPGNPLSLDATET
ncbi:polysaccharide deacetylase [Rubrobacter xylanophilus DSM 9941]|uniref:Polysaccharide deacetylase n=1 Tax=Rubrobacter xylanophilus (strain DSM 9941 / JCM 11954 / NBRC 16129 / PRD-1) TaxID=266117 RepID=Q1AZJ7_RUBXD|nr:polysaccharide deacetylase family protein [Rubrobacter xylanophilus]ABG03181.1 polysaccharide deacetylase [Rubrobacter xylanophilus DSM 9941]